MASHICDFCVNKNTGQFFHGNRTLADALGVNERSVQRYLAELVRLGWLLQVRVRGQRRTFQLTFPGGLPAREHDKMRSSAETNLTSQHDKDDAPITNQVNNNTKPNIESRSFSVVTITDREQDSLKKWHTWISTNTEHDSEKVLQMLRKAGGYQLPARYPAEAEHKRILYMEYIEAVMTRKILRRRGEG